MSREMDLEYFKNLKYLLLVKEMDGKFIVLIPELGLIEEDENLEKAYQKIKATKERYFKKMIEFKLQEEIKNPSSESITVVDKRSSKNNILRFLGKTMVILIIVMVTVSFTLGRLETLLSKTIAPVKKNLSLDKAILGASVIFDKINEIPDGKVETAKIKLRKIIQKFKPLIDEFKTVSQDETKVISENIMPQP